MNDLRTGPVAELIRAQRLIAILRRVEPQDRLLGVIDELADAGVRVFEITFDSPTAAEDLAAVKRRLDPGCVVGAGTLLTRDQLERAVAAGADFGVTPVLHFDLLATAVRIGLPFMVGGLTPTEMLEAWSSGATFVKLFPASTAGPQMIREIHGPLPEIEIIPTGGVTPENARSFLDAGAVAVGLGSALVRATRAERQALIESVTR